MNLLGKLRLYANRCPHCGLLMRNYAGIKSPVPLPTLTTARLCPRRHYMETEHISTRAKAVFDEGGKPLAHLAEVADLPDQEFEEKSLHENLNVPARAKAKHAAAPAAKPAAAAAPAAPAAGVAPATAPAVPTPVAEPTAAPQAAASSVE